MINIGSRNIISNMNINSNGNVVTINGKTYKGNSIVSKNGKVFVDGQLAEDKEMNSVTIIIEGNVGELTTDCPVTVQGDVLGSIKTEGSVTCKKVGKNVTAGGSISCDDVGGNVNAGGSVRCDDVRGNVFAGGSIRCN